MDFPAFIKDKWVILMDIVLCIYVFVGDIVKPPYLTQELVASTIDIIKLSKFLILGILLILILPFSVLNSKKSARVYWLISIVLFLISAFSVWNYINQINERTAFNAASEERVVIGTHYLPGAIRMIDILQRKNPDLNITPSILLEGSGPPSSLWSEKEIHSNARALLVNYLFVITSCAVFILFALQSLKTSSS